MADLLIGLVIISITGMSIWKFRSEKKKGAKCVGCPYSVSSGDNKGCSCG